jgi:3-oxoacyl-[acyl-carrier-protein] synthase-3
VLLVGSEVISKTLDWTDRTTSILFGDGAGAVVVQGTGREKTGVLASHLSSNGGMGDILTLSAWGENRLMQMRGNEVFKHAIRLMSEAVARACDKAGLGTEEIDLLIPHQANIRIIKGLAEHLGVSMSKVVTNIERFGNTSSASIPLALNDAIVDGRVGEGTLCVLTALGGGVTVGGAVVRF